MKSLLFVFNFGWPYLRKYCFRFAVGILFGILFGLSNASFVWATKTLFDRLSPSANAAVSTPSAPSQMSLIQDRLKNIQEKISQEIDQWLPSYGRAMDWRQAAGALLFLPFLMLIRGAAGYINAYCMIWVSERVMKDLKLGVLRKLHALSLDYFDRSASGDMITRISGDTTLLHRCMSLGFSDLIKEPVTLISVFIALCALDWKLAVFTLFFLPLCVLPIQVLSKKVRRASKGTVAAQISQSSLLIEMLAGIRVIKAFGLEKTQQERFDSHSEQLVHHSVKATKAKELVNPIIEVISVIGLGVMIVYVSLTHQTTADLVAFLTGLVLFFTPVKKLAAVNVLFNQTRIGVERLQNLFAEKPSVKEPPHPVEKTDFKNAIVFENVSFAYHEKPVLQNISLKIPRGYRLGIAGESGSGKSTLVNLIFRFYDCENGAVKLDEVDVKNMKPQDVRKLMALVNQHTILFDQSVADNIACGKHGATREEVLAAAKAANAHDFIIQLPQGYDTRIGEQGVTLSGGQRQRLAIARAFVRDAPILVLDEATASLDSHAEEEVQTAIEHLSKQKTVICVAHRLSTLRESDEIVVLSEGRVIERGKFDELMSKNGAFAEMARKQGL